MKRLILATALTLAFLGVAQQRAAAWHGGTFTISGALQGHLTFGLHHDNHYYHAPVMPPPAPYLEPLGHYHGYHGYAPAHPEPVAAPKEKKSQLPQPNPAPAAAQQTGYYYYPASWGGYTVPGYWYGE